MQGFRDVRGSLCQVFCYSVSSRLPYVCGAGTRASSACSPDAPDGRGSVFVPEAFSGWSLHYNDRIALNSTVFTTAK